MEWAIYALCWLAGTTGLAAYFHFSPHGVEWGNALAAAAIASTVGLSPILGLHLLRRDEKRLVKLRNARKELAEAVQTAIIELAKVLQAQQGVPRNQPPHPLVHAYAGVPYDTCSVVLNNDRWPSAWTVQMTERLTVHQEWLRHLTNAGQIEPRMLQTLSLPVLATAEVVSQTPDAGKVFELLRCLREDLAALEPPADAA